MTVCSMTRSKVKVKVTISRKSEIRPFSKVISSPIYSGGWQMTMDSYISLLRVVGVVTMTVIIRCCEVRTVNSCSLNI